MGDFSDDQLKAYSKKRVRRNAIKPNSAESDLLREFVVHHQLSQIQITLNEDEPQQNDEGQQVRKAIRRGSNPSINVGDSQSDPSSEENETSLINNNDHNNSSTSNNKSDSLNKQSKSENADVDHNDSGNPTVYTL